MIKLNNLTGQRFYFKNGMLCKKDEVIISDRRDQLYGTPITYDEFGAILLCPGNPGKVLIQKQISPCYTVSRLIEEWYRIPGTPSRKLAQEILDKELQEENWSDDGIDDLDLIAA